MLFPCPGELDRRSKAKQQLLICVVAAVARVAVYGTCERRCTCVKFMALAPMRTGTVGSRLRIHVAAEERSGRVELSGLVLPKVWMRNFDILYGSVIVSFCLYLVKHIQALTN